MRCLGLDDLTACSPDAHSGLGGDRTHVVVVAVRTVLVALVVLGHVLSESLLALLAEEGHLRRLREPVGLRLRMAFGAVKPLLAAWRAYGYLGVEDVFAG